MTNTEKLFLNRQKMDLFSEWISEEDIYVQLDAKEGDVCVPESHKSDPMLTLKMSTAFNFTPEVDENGIKVNLKFDSGYFQCSIPWERVWGLRTESGQQKIWKEDIPKEVAIKMAKEVFSNLGSKLLAKAKPSKEKEAEKETEAKPKHKASHLKRIK